MVDKPRRAFRTDQVAALLQAPEHHHGGAEFGLICDSCAIPPGGFSGQAPENFVGKEVQLAFATGLEEVPHERMWVHVDRLHDGEEDEQLQGTLLNQPQFTSQWGDRGSLVAFKVSEIIKVADTAPPAEGSA